MITANDAFKKAKAASDVKKLQDKITADILKAVEDGSFWTSEDVSAYSETVINIILQWLKQFGYAANAEKWEDARSGWAGETLKISWEKED